MQTQRFGELTINEKDILLFPEGIIGIPDFKRAILVDHSENSPFKWLQSADDPAMAFVVIDPVLLAPDYPLETLQQEFYGEGKKSDDIVVAAITTVPPAPETITVNMCAPLVFDVATRKGKQIVLNDQRYVTRQPLVTGKDEEEKAEKEPQADQKAAL